MKQRNNPFGVKAASCALAALLSASPLFATTYYLNFSESGNDGATSHAWTNLVYWSTKAGTTGDGNHPSSFSSEDEFVVSPHSNGFTLRTITDVSEWIGKCLRVGGEPHLNTSSLAVLRHQIRGEDVSVTYRNDGLVLGDRGRYYAYFGKGKVCHIYGTITVESTSANYSAQLYSANQENSSLHFHDAFKGNADARLKILNTKENFVVKIDNPTAYYGTITSTNTVDNANNNSLFLGNDFPGTLSLAGATTLVVSDGCKINSLSLGVGAVIDATAGAFSITGAFENASAVTVRVDTAQFPGTVDLVSGPAGTFTLDDFVFTDSSGAPLDFLDSLTLVETEDGIAVRALQYPVATLISHDNNSRTKTYESSMTNSSHWSNADYWSDTATMPGGWHYRLSASTGKYLRTAYSGKVDAPEGDIVFPGLSLTLPATTRLIMLNPSFDCQNLVLDGGELDPSVYTDTTFSGKITVTQNGGVVSTYLRECTIQSEIEGSGDLRISAASGTATGSSFGYFTLAGINTNFTGSIVARIPVYTPGDIVAETNKITPRFDRNYLHFRISDKRNLGGPLPAVNPKSLTIENMSRLELAAGCTSLVLDEPTRGIFVNWVGRFLADSGQTMTIASPLAVHGTMWKEGAGTLVLANPQPTFGATAAAETPDDASTNRTFRVEAGTVKIASGRAVNGLDVVVKSGASLALDLGSSDADIAAYGIRNELTPGVPFAADGAATVGLNLVLPENYEPSEAVPVATVKAEDADGVDAILVVRKPTGGGGMRTLAKSRKNVTINETACVTFTVDTTAPGLVISIR